MLKSSVKLMILIMACMFNGLLASGADDDDWNPSMLRPGDVLAIEVFRVAEFTRTARIENDGTFTYPLCGTIKAAGLTPRDVAKEMEKRLAVQVANPQVEVKVEEWAPRRVYILGEVANSASLQLPTYGRMTVLQAISEAGGVTESADLDNVVVLRRVTKGNKSKLERIKVDVSVLASYSKGGEVEDFRLRPEDTLVVPKAQPVFITGEVQSSVVYIDTRRPPFVSELIIRAGGLKVGANASKIMIARKGKDETIQIINASLKQDMGKGVYENDVQVQPGDYVMVTAAEQIYVLGEVQKPGPLTLPPNKVVTASQAIALAGGFTPMARQGKVTLIRGKNMVFLNLSKLYDDIESLARDEELQDGDILFVRESFW